MTTARTNVPVEIYFHRCPAHEAEQKEEREAEREIVHQETEALADEIRALRRELGEVKSLLKER